MNELREKPKTRVRAGRVCVEHVTPAPTFGGAWIVPSRPIGSTYVIPM